MVRSMLEQVRIQVSTVGKSQLGKGKKKLKEEAREDVQLTDVRRTEEGEPIGKDVQPTTNEANAEAREDLQLTDVKRSAEGEPIGKDVQPTTNEANAAEAREDVQLTDVKHSAEGEPIEKDVQPTNNEANAEAREEVQLTDVKCIVEGEPMEKDVQPTTNEANAEDREDVQLTDVRGSAEGEPIGKVMQPTTNEANAESRENVQLTDVKRTAQGEPIGNDVKPTTNEANAGSREDVQRTDVKCAAEGEPTGKDVQPTTNEANAEGDPTTTRKRGFVKRTMATGNDELNGEEEPTTKKKKVLHWIRCELCDVECNSQTVLDLHLGGKKHAAQLKTGNDAQSTNEGEPTTTKKKVFDNDMKPATGGEPTGNDVKPTNVEPNAERESTTKKKKAVDWIQCELCNVECNSQTVLDLHCGGKKHAARLKTGNDVQPINVEPNLEGEPTTKKKKKVHMIRCELCNVECNCQTVLDLHFGGKKHAARLKELREGAVACNTEQPTLTEILPQKMQKLQAELAVKIAEEEGRGVTSMLEQVPMQVSTVGKPAQIGKGKKKLKEESREDVQLTAVKCTGEGELIGKDVQPTTNEANAEGDPTGTKKSVFVKPTMAIGNDEPNGEEEPTAKKKKVVHWIRCELCNVECNSQAALDLHFGGKKHAAQLKTGNDVQPTNEGEPTTTKKKVIVGNVVKPTTEGEPTRYDVQPTNGEPNTEREPTTKKKKVVHWIRCELCNVECNSQAVLDLHCGGRKHAARPKAGNDVQPTNVEPNLERAPN